MRDTIYRDDAIRVASGYCHWTNIPKELSKLPSAEPEQAKYVPDTKAIPSSRDCVDLSERVTATFYDDEHEEWSQKTVTIRDVLDSVCDEYTVLPSAEPEVIRCKDCKFWTYIKRTNRYWCKTDDGLYDLNPSPDDFCSRAERRTDE